MACGKPLPRQSDNYSPTRSLEIAAFHTPHIKRATIYLWVVAALLAISAGFAGFEISAYAERVAAFRREIVRSERSDGFGWARDELRNAEALISGAKAGLAIQIAVIALFVIAALSFKKKPRQASLVAAYTFGGYVLLLFIAAPGAFVTPTLFVLTSLMAIVLYLAVVAGKKIQQANERSL